VSIFTHPLLIVIIHMLLSFELFAILVIVMVIISLTAKDKTEPLKGYGKGNG